MPESEPMVSKVADQFDPARCKGPARHGQCWNKAVGSGNYCEFHGGSAILKSDKAKETRQYQIEHAAFRNRHDELVGNSKLLDMAEELGLLKLLIEGKINQCRGDLGALVMSAGPLGDLITKVERITTAIIKVQKHTNENLGEKQVMELALKTIDVIKRHILDPAIIELIADELMEVFTSGIQEIQARDD